MRLTLTVFTLVLVQTAFAQSTRALRCPTHKKEFVSKPPSHLDLSTGMAVPFLYRNVGGKLPDPFKFASHPGPCLSITEYYAVSQKLELLAGVEVMQSEYGMKINVSEQGNSFTEKFYNGTFVARVPLGVSYSPLPRLSIAVTPYAAWCTNWSGKSTGRSTAGGTGGTLSTKWQEQEAFEKFYFGSTLATRFDITRKLSTTLFGSIDFASSAPSEGQIEAVSNGQASTYTARSEPYLFYAGITLSYRIWDQYSL